MRVKRGGAMDWNQFNRDIRKEFPALGRTIHGYPAAFLDGPGGYQIPQRVIDAIVTYLTTMNANMDGSFTTSQETAQVIEGARRAFADFFHCASDEVVFGANMTTLNFLLSQALVRTLDPGDHILITEIDHEGNRGPWEQLRDREVFVDETGIDPETCTLDMTQFEINLQRGPKVVAINYASNAVGTINDVKTMVALAREVGALTVVDAVHYAAHGPIDVREIGADFLLCSAYKFFGPHIGLMFGRKEVLDRLHPLKVRPQHNDPPYKIETGTLNHEGIAGAAEAVQFVADWGLRLAERDGHVPATLPGSRRERIVAALRVFAAYELQLTAYLVEELGRIEGIRIYGPPKGHPRTSTVSFTVDRLTARTVSQYLDSRGLLVWDGDFFATRLVERLGAAERGGLVRVGIAPYNSKEEIDRLIDAMRDKDALWKYARGAA
jgi:cysteine desulfurase family protein (TIGR01976 family)